MPAGSYANLGGSCLQEMKTTKRDKRPKETRIDNNDDKYTNAA